MHTSNEKEGKQGAGGQAFGRTVTECTGPMNQMPTLQQKMMKMDVHLTPFLQPALFVLHTC
eukprot:scaffold173592_cov19-Tisochrysis_lutea.AAC.2